MGIDVTSFENASRWLQELKQPHLLLGNGFSIAFSSKRFSYSALRSRAESEKRLGPLAMTLFANLNTQDFETVIKTLEDAALGLEALDAAKYRSEISEIRNEASQLKETLARILAALHPERPSEINQDAYLRVREFIQHFNAIYTANYDLLLYWCLMQDLSEHGLPERRHDDGFRDPGYEADYVTWDHLKPARGSVHYLHGALHLYRKEDHVKKLTWRRTDIALVDQIREQLTNNSFPLYVTEGTSKEKLARIEGSNYLGHALRSLAAIGGSLLTYGMSFSANDQHIIDAIFRSSITRLAVSLFGDPGSPDNAATIRAITSLQSRRNNLTRPNPLEVRFFDAGSVRLWH